ncbi:hypothetical protein SD457_21790 [Coprobacillaceae bacterium CR2/5/TPMF4]|nr:hypothetical protein SD457_21790 [Coprobacillaceae bacterium CR2/5/TPMF4]
MEYVTLSNGIKMPILGFGVLEFQIKKNVKNLYIKLLKQGIV